MYYIAPNAAKFQPKKIKQEDEEEVEEYQTWEFLCPYCPRTFSSAQALGGHQNAHRRQRQHEKHIPLEFRCHRKTSIPTTVYTGGRIDTTPRPPPPLIPKDWLSLGSPQVNLGGLSLELGLGQCGSSLNRPSSPSNANNGGVGGGENGITDHVYKSVMMVMKGGDHLNRMKSMVGNGFWELMNSGGVEDAESRVSTERTHTLFDDDDDAPCEVCSGKKAMHVVTYAKYK
ncbi:hypothetical protein RJ641_026504 [Dillenia turbinata]|uniref:C2H2-type domain-containing protein n=1 Tax=Dillenia turbinata TaxID=194707 RepID=A0AAN8WGA8_9MAGN